MVQHVNRRTVFQKIGFIGLSILSGCLLFENRPELEAIRVRVFNNTGNEHTFKVQLINEEGSTVFENVFDLEAGERAHQETDLTATEYQVIVYVDGKKALDDSWSWRGCRTGNIQITFWSATEGNAESSCINE